MLALKPLTPQCLWHMWRWPNLSQSRSLHWTRGDGYERETALKSQQRRPSSLEELDPDEARKAAARKRYKQNGAFNKPADGSKPRSRRLSLLEELNPDEIQRAAEGRGHRKTENLKPRPLQLSLLEELFPDEVYRVAEDRAETQRKGQELPRIPLPEVDELFADFSDERELRRRRPARVTRAAAADAFRRQRLAVVALQIASKSLVESDFRRVAPRGRHIEEWTGPGDILKGAWKQEIVGKAFLLIRLLQ